MNVKVMKFLLIGTVLAVVGVVAVGGIVAGRAYADSPWGRGWCGDYGGFGMMGRGMMGGWSEFCPLFDNDDWPSSDDEARADRAPLSLEDVEAKVEAFLREEDDNLALAEVMEFSNHFYAEAIEKDTGFGAFEMLIDRYTGEVYPEMGPNMMWNEKYGMMGGRRAMMMGSRWMNRRSDPTSMPVTPEEAVKLAQEYLADRNMGLTIDSDDVTTFYGYYTLHTLKDGQPEGMLSVNGYSGRVWYHSWHGDFVRMSEHEEEGVSGHAEAGEALDDNGGASVKSSRYVDISPDELRAMSGSKDFVLINVHVPYEGELRNTDLFIPYNEVKERAGQLPADKDAPIVVYCRSGSMSQSAARDLVELGYTNVYHLTGGMLSWKDAGYELLQKVE